MPEATSRLGWQAFDSVIKLGGNNASAGADKEAVNLLSAGEDQYAPAFPLDTYNPLLPNPAPLTELTIIECFPLSPCKPASTTYEDATIGKWVKVDRQLDSVNVMHQGSVNKAENGKGSAPNGGGAYDRITSIFGAGANGLISELEGIFEQRWLFYRRSRRTDVKGRLVDVRIVELGQTPPDGKEGWHRVKHDIRVGWVRLSGKAPAAHLYFRTDAILSKRSEDLTEGERRAQKEIAALDPITEVDIVYGPNKPMPGFQLVGQILPDSEAAKTPGAQLAIRRKVERPPELPTPIVFKKEGTFKILQLADLHFSVENEYCRNVSESVEWVHSQGKRCRGELETIPRIEKWLDDEKPDLVVLSGDQFNGQGTSWDERSTLMKVIQPMIDRKIMWAWIMGNHDSQSGFLSRRQLQHLLRQMPYSKTFAGPEAMHGVSNYYLNLHSPTPDRTWLASLYFMDTGALAPTVKGSGYFGLKKPKDGGVSDYDYIHTDQIRWFEDRSKKAKKLVRPYEPDGAKDLDPLWDRSSALEVDASLKMIKRHQSERAQMMIKPTGIVFQHIPLPEAFNGTVDLDPRTGRELIVGERQEQRTLDGGQSRGGFFDAVLNSDKADDTKTSGRDVQLIVHGHMHTNEDCRRVKGVWICFGGGSSFAAYGNKDLKRRSRVIELQKWGEKIVTWHRYDDGTKSEPYTLYSLAA